MERKLLGKQNQLWKGQFCERIILEKRNLEMTTVTRENLNTRVLNRKTEPKGQIWKGQIEKLNDSVKGSRKRSIQKKDNYEREIL